MKMTKKHIIFDFGVAFGMLSGRLGVRYLPWNYGTGGCLLVGYYLYPGRSAWGVKMGFRFFVGVQEHR